AQPTDSRIREQGQRENLRRCDDAPEKERGDTMFRSLITATVLLSAMTLASFGAQQQPQQQQPQQPPQQQQDQQQQKQKDSASKNPDRRFMTEAAQGGMAEVELGRIAAERASNEEVKRFGQRMVDD